MKITDADLIRHCTERAASYGALRTTAPTAIALDAAAARLTELTKTAKEQRSARPPLIVWSPDGDTPPKVAHQSHGSAHRAAHQLAAKHPDRTFYVMERSGRPIKASDGDSA